MLGIRQVHHIAVICTNYEKSKAFYTDVLGLTIIQETYRKERNSFKLDLALNGVYTIELFSFPHPPPRPTRPESTGLRHLAFAVEDIEATIPFLERKGVPHEAVRRDEITGKKFLFLFDPDHLPIELYEA